MPENTENWRIDNGASSNVLRVEKVLAWEALFSAVAWEPGE